MTVLEFDLHNHSYYSDGIFSPSVLVDLGKAQGLAGLALTDHDTLSGLEEFVTAGAEAGVISVPGVEMTTQYQGVELHILGYKVDHNHSGLRRRLEKVITTRITRAKEILSKLQRVGIDLNWDDLEKVCQNTRGRYVGRPHIYRALKEKGIIGEDPQGAGFQYYLGVEGVAYVPHQELPTLEALELISNAGGLSVLAHPGRLENLRMLRTLKANGLAGIEVFYPAHPPEVRVELLRIADQLALFPTGGSDFHGSEGTARMGAATVERRFIEALL